MKKFLLACCGLFLFSSTSLFAQGPNPLADPAILSVTKFAGAGQGNQIDQTATLAYQFVNASVAAPNTNGEVPPGALFLTLSYPTLFGLKAGVVPVVPNFTVLYYFTGPGGQLALTNAVAIAPGDELVAYVDVVGFSVGTQTTLGNVDRQSPILCGNASIANDNAPGQFIVTVPLPVTLGIFTAKETTCGVVDLNWTTESERGVSQYGVEYSKDGRNFATVKTLAAKNAANGTVYATRVNQEENVGYYRIKMIDFDKKFTYSPVVKVSLNCVSAQIKVYPNPITEVVYVSSLKGTETITIYSIDGKKMLEQKAISGENALRIASLTNGSYNLVITNGEEISNFKLVKN